MIFTDSEIADSYQSGESYSHPDVVRLNEEPTTAQSVKFRSHSSKTIALFWDDGKKGVPSATLRPDAETTLNSYSTHKFYMAYSDDKKRKRLATFVIQREKGIYVFYDEKNPGSAEERAKTKRELEYLKEYREKTGLLWRSYYGSEGPRAPPILPLWPATFKGQRHVVNTVHGFWMCNDTTSADCKPSSAGVQLTLEAFSLEPRAFIIKNFLSEAECDHIIATATPKLGQSTVGNSDGGGVKKSTTRTSKTTWVGRNVSPLTESLYLRAADVLGVDEKILTPGTNAEEMQVVYYEIGQKYDAHHDWGVSGYPESRFATLLLYLTDKQHGDAGGDTSFPKAKPHGVRVHPGKGSAVLFYNLLEDGNADDLALHAAMPVKEGSKWLANFWVWDPKRK